MNILLATDSSKHSEAAAEILNYFKFSEGDQIKILSAVDMALSPVTDLYGGYLPDTSVIEKIPVKMPKKLLNELYRT